MVALLARTKFYGGGHKLSGFDAAHLGRDTSYVGRGRVRPKTPVGAETIAQRRAREAAEARGEKPPGDEPVSDDKQDTDVHASTGGKG